MTVGPGAKVMKILPGFDRYALSGYRALDGEIVRAYPNLETGEWGTEVIDYVNGRYVKTKVITIFDMCNVCQSIPAQFLEDVEPI